jgi:dihydropteroate synthase
MLYEINPAFLAKELQSLKMNEVAVNILMGKGSIIPFKVTDVRTPAANIIKQEMLAAGGDCAVPAGTVTCAEDRVDIILLGTKKHYRTLIYKLKQMSYFGIQNIYKELTEAMQENTKKTVLADGRELVYTRTMVMGIINATPDSFYPASRTKAQDALTVAETMLKDGADILDIGGASTRPGTELVTKEEEQKRVLPVIKSIKEHFPQCVISVDTYWAETAKAALSAGADIINDVSAMEMDPKMLDVVSETKAPIILMHMRGTPKDMQKQCIYQNVVQEVALYLQQRATLLLDRGLDATKIILDPGIGFAKNVDQNLELMGDLEALTGSSFPVLLAASRKSTIGTVLGGIPVEERLAGTLATSARAVEAGADMVRVHDVQENVQFIRMLEAIKRGKA